MFPEAGRLIVVTPAGAISFRKPPAPSEELKAKAITQTVEDCGVRSGGNDRGIPATKNGG